MWIVPPRDQLRHHAPHRVRRHRKADARRGAAGADDLRIHADHASLQIEQRTARVAAIDWRIDLQVIVVGAGVDIAAERGNDTHGHGAAQSERVADRDYPFTNPGTVGIAELNVR